MIHQRNEFFFLKPKHISELRKLTFLLLLFHIQLTEHFYLEYIVGFFFSKPWHAHTTCTFKAVTSSWNDASQENDSYQKIAFCMKKFPWFVPFNIFKTKCKSKWKFSVWFIFDMLFLSPYGMYKFSPTVTMFLRYKSWEKEQCYFKK